MNQIDKEKTEQNNVRQDETTASISGVWLVVIFVGIIVVMITMEILRRR